MNFSISEKQVDRVNRWLDTLKPQIKDGNYGAIGGGITFMFTHTGLGDVIQVKECITGEVLDITDYDQW